VISYNETGILAGLRTALIIMLFIGGGGAVLLTIAAFFGDTWWLFDYAANFRWQLFWGLIVAAILYTIAARGIASIVFLAAALLNAWLVVPLWMGTQPAATGENGVRVVHADVYPRVDDSGFMLRWLLESGADLILVAGTTADRMEPLTADGSPYSIIVSPERPGVPGIVALGTEDWPVEVTHTEGLAEPVYRITVGANGEIIDVVTAWGDPASNSKEADRLGARLDAVSAAVASASHPVAVIGNLGATRWTHGMETMRDTTGMRDATEGYGYLSTWPVSDVPLIGGWIGIPIDVVLMTDEITPLELSTGPDIGAAHLPVIVVIGPAFES
jgi:endonuclease/exonuclease/phosphatase (EEP) superfamily protein YafD